MLNIVILSKSHLKKLKEYKLALILTIAVVFTSFSQNPVGIGTVAPHPSAILEVSSTNKGFLPPRMSEDQMKAINIPAEGLIVYCLDCSPKGIYIFDNDRFSRMLSLFEHPSVEYLNIADVRIIKGITTSFDISPTLIPRGATVDYELITSHPEVAMEGTRIDIATNIRYGEHNITVKATGKDNYIGETVATFKLNVIPPAPAYGSCFSFPPGIINTYRCTAATVIIPASIKGIAVTSIGDAAFHNKNLSSVYIPNSVTSIGNNAFRTASLISVYIPDSVRSIGNFAFYDNNLSSVTIPDSVTHIGTSAFYTNNLSSVYISNSVRSIGNFAFSKNKLTSVTIPDSVRSIGPYAFQGNSLTSVSIKDGTHYIAFGNNSSFDSSCTEGNGCITRRP